MTGRGGRWTGPLVLGATLVVLAVLAGVRTWSRAGGGEGWAMPPETVGVIPAEARPWRATSVLLGTLAAEAAIDVRAEVGGRLVEVGFESGAVVRRGAVLARLDTALEEAELRGVEAELRATTLRRDRTAELADARGATRMDADQADADVAATAARADALRARIRQKTIVAPFDGRVGVRTHHPGEVVDPGVRLTTLVRTTDDVFVDVWVPQTLVAAVPVGAVLAVRVGEATAEARVEVVEPAADPTRRAVRVRARVAPAPPGWLPGLAARAEVPTDAETPRVIVPASALVWSPVGVLVYRVVPGEAGEVVTANPVEILSDLGDEVVLASGLEPGARIVADGAFKLHEGAAIRAAGVARE